MTAEGTTSKGTGSISCEVEFCIFYRLSLRTLRTKDVLTFVPILLAACSLPFFGGIIAQRSTQMQSFRSCEFCCTSKPQQL
jgi:hypothetical protein